MALDNKLGISNDLELAREEERLTKLRALELNDSGLLDGLEVGTFAGLAAIHRRLFQDVYAFAGERRTVNIAKGNFSFAPVMYLDAALEAIDKMPQGTFDQIVEKSVEMNVAHPFREGNGRSTRIWLNCILKRGGAGPRGRLEPRGQGGLPARDGAEPREGRRDQGPSQGRAHRSRGRPSDLHEGHRRELPLRGLQHLLHGRLECRVVSSGRVSYGSAFPG